MDFRVIPVPGQGAEDVVVALGGPDEGAVFTGTEDGTIHRIRARDGQVAAVPHTGGRPPGGRVPARPSAAGLRRPARGTHR
jgi:hypothetical protein